MLDVIELKNVKIRELEAERVRTRVETKELREILEEYEAGGAKRRPKPKPQPKQTANSGAPGTQPNQQDDFDRDAYAPPIDDDDFWQEREDLPQPIAEEDLWIQQQAQGELGASAKQLTKSLPKRVKNAGDNDMEYYGVG